MSSPDTLSRGKRSITVDLKKEEGENSLQVIYQLLPTVDVILEGGRPGVMEKLKLGPTHVRHYNQHIIYARLSGFGQTGEFKLFPGHDSTYISKAGVLDMFRRYRQGDDPDKCQRDKPVFPFHINMLVGSHYLFVQILERLVQRKLGIKPQSTDDSHNVIDHSMVDEIKYIFKDQLDLKAKDELDDHDLCQHPLNAVY